MSFVALQASTSALCELDAASLFTHYHEKVQNVIEKLRTDGYAVSADMERAHTAMFARWCQLFPVTRFDDADPANLNKYVVKWGNNIAVQSQIHLRRRRSASTRALHR